jgi:hypothetical protein
MRDDFRNGVKATLGKRASYVCSNPDCRKATVGPGSEADSTVSIGVAAHITGASPGGPRYDASLTSSERAGSGNGVWLCETCGKVVDSDVPKYTVELLQRWKAEAEERARLHLGVAHGDIAEPLDLALPSVDDDDFLLSFANTSLDAIGREDELADLELFLNDDRAFSWWLWTGPAGMGKSRLALELCRAQSDGWHAGFLGEHDQSRLAASRPLIPTLVVIDYAAQRSVWLSESLYALSHRQSGVRVRVLILEREASGDWWSTVQRHHRLSEAPAVATSMYALPAELHGVSRDSSRRLIAAAAHHLGATPTRTQVEVMVDHADYIDPLRRPLFALVATLDSLADAISVDRDEALRRLITRADAQLSDGVGESAATFRASNARLLATLLGGLSIEDYGALLASGLPAAPPGLLPALYDVYPAGLNELLNGLLPDIVGERSSLTDWPRAASTVTPQKPLGILLGAGRRMLTRRSSNVPCSITAVIQALPHSSTWLTPMTCWRGQTCWHEPSSRLEIPIIRQSAGYSNVSGKHAKRTRHMLWTSPYLLQSSGSRPSSCTREIQSSRTIFTRKLFTPPTHRGLSMQTPGTIAEIHGGTWVDAILQERTSLPSSTRLWRRMRSARCPTTTGLIPTTMNATRVLPSPTVLPCSNSPTRVLIGVTSRSVGGRGRFGRQATTSLQLQT